MIVAKVKRILSAWPASSLSQMDDELPVDVAAASDGGLAACTRAANYDDDGGYAQCQSVSHEYGLHSLTPTERLACQELLLEPWWPSRCP